VRICIAGAGLAGAVLVWRLAGAAPQSWRIDWYLGTGAAGDGTGGERAAGNGAAGGTARDATAVSGGAVRAYETDLDQRALAAQSLAELLGSAVLRDWAGYRAGAAVSLRPSRDGLETAAAAINAVLPGSAHVAGAAELAGLGFAGLPPDAAAVVEAAAGWVSPARLRASVLADGAVRRRVRLVPGLFRPLTPRPAGAEHDLVVLATGPWTPAVLARAGLPAAGYRTKAIQYAVHPVAGGLPPQFVDGLTGLFGRPTGDGGLLLGLPTDRWDVEPDRPPADPALPAAAAELARARFPGLRLGPAGPPAVGCDCYPGPAAGGSGLALRPVPGVPALFTFTGGAGASAKTALAASRQASARLLAAGPDPQPTPAPTEGRR